MQLDYSLCCRGSHRQLVSWGTARESQRLCSENETCPQLSQCSGFTVQQLLVISRSMF